MSPRDRREQQQRALAILEADDACPAASASAAGADAAARFQELTSAHVATLLAEGSLACREGCSSCCHLEVSATFPELLRLASHLSASWSADDLAALRERIDLRCSATEVMDARERARGDRACVLLRDDRCSAYDARPLACRGWTSADAGACREALGRPDSPPSIPVHAVLRATALDVSVGVGAAARELGRDDSPLDMLFALRDLLGREVEWAEAWQAGRMLPSAWHSRVDPVRDRGADGLWRWRD